MGLPWHRRYRRTILSQAVWAVQAGQLLPSGRGLVDLSGNGNHAYFGGNASTPTTNDPTVLPWRGQKEVWFPGTTGNYISTPDSAALSIAGDITLIAALTPNVWNTATQYLIAKRQTSAQIAYSLNLSALGVLSARFSSNGNLNVGESVDSTASLPFSDGAFGWVAATRSAGTVKFWTSSNGVTWTQLGATQTITNTGNIFDSSASVRIGTSDSNDNPLVGRVSRAQIYSGIPAAFGGSGGTLVADFNANSLSDPYAPHTDPQGNVWTLNRSSSGLKLAVVDRDMLALGTDDYLEVANNPLLNFNSDTPFTVVGAVRCYGTAAVGYVVAKRQNGGTGWGLSLTDTLTVRAGMIVSNVPTIVDTPSAAWSPGVAFLAAMVRDGADWLTPIAVGSSKGAPTSFASSVVNTEPLRIGARSGGAFLDFEFLGAAVFREALTDDDLRRLAQELGVES